MDGAAGKGTNHLPFSEKGKRRGGEKDECIKEGEKEKRETDLQRRQALPLWRVVWAALSTGGLLAINDI